MTQTLPRLLVVNTGAVDHDGMIKLLSAILADTVWLPSASCVGRHALSTRHSGTVANTSGRNRSG
jgi:hypothetical protein